jgi:hypothetical protein
LTGALIDVMDAPDPALAAIAAWALGRIGDAQAIPALRKAFSGAKYHSVRAHAVRALGTLRDKESIPSLLQEIKSDSDLGLKVVCASSLSKLRVAEAAPELLHILYVDNYPQSRRELGMCVARLLNAEGRYIELSRSLYEYPGTASTREMDSVRGIVSKKFVGRDDVIQQLTESRDQFAQGLLDLGYQPLLTVINFLVLEETEPGCRQILLEAGACMHEFSLQRMEYLLLALVAMEKCIR